MQIKPVILIIGILIGYIAGVEILFFDNTSGEPSFATGFSNFSKITSHDVSKQLFSEPTTLANRKEEQSQLWFFRENPSFLIWVIMHVIGVALCLAMCITAYFMQKNLRKAYTISSKKIWLAWLIVLVPLGLIVYLSYTNAYGFDYVAHLIPLNHAPIKIYCMEGLNYFTGAFNLVNMMLVTFAAEEHATALTEHDINYLRKFFNSTLYITAVVIGYATLASGALYKALNIFYYNLYDISEKSSPYFPLTIIIVLGLINTFLLSMFYIPCAKVFKNIKQAHIRHLIHSVQENDAPKQLPVFFGLTKEMLEMIQILFALLSPLLLGIIS